MSLPVLQFAYCHRKPERSFFWKGKQFPVCARCTGIHIGYLAYPLFLFDVFSLNIWVTLALLLPTYIDGLVQAFLRVESNNLRRVTTGILAGVGVVSLVCIVGTIIGNKILSLIN